MRHGRPSDRQAWATLRPHGGVREVCRLHSLLPETIRIRKLGGEVEAVPFVETRQAGSAKLSARVSMADRGWQKSSPRGFRFSIAGRGSP